MAIKWKDNIRRLFLNFNLIDIFILMFSLFVLPQIVMTELNDGYCDYVAKHLGVSTQVLTKTVILNDQLTFKKYVNEYIDKQKEKIFNNTENYLKDNLKDFNINNPVSRSNFRVFLKKDYENMSGVIILNKEENYIITNETAMISSSSLSINEEETKKLNDGMETIYYKLNNFNNIQKLASSLNSFRVHKNIEINLQGKTLDAMMFSNATYLWSEFDNNDMLKIIRSGWIVLAIFSIIIILLLMKLILSIKRYKRNFFKKIVEEDFILNINGSIGLKPRFYIQLTLETLMILVLLLSSIKGVRYERFNIFYFVFDQACIKFGISMLILLHLLKSYKLLKVRRKIEDLAKGNYQKIKISNIDYNKEIYSMINNVSDGYNNMLLENTKNERLKTELITNISHDLKTPLTSIINYVDILNNQKVEEEDEKKYLKIIEEKAYRLKTLILDLFEVSKLSSGKVELEKNNVNIIDLVYQCLGECETSNINKNLDIIVNKNEEPINLMVDGELLSRAFENIINNIYKYSLEGTRVYIDIIKDKKNFKIIFKNISKYPLNFDGSELFERFVRGDIARNSSTEGSGLGLAIAKAIIELHGFNIDIKINGDLFLLEIGSEK